MARDFKSPLAPELERAAFELGKAMEKVGFKGVPWDNDILAAIGLGASSFIVGNRSKADGQS